MTKAPVSVRVSHRFAASPERVFDAWLNPAMVVRWLFRSPDGERVSAQIDARVGGRFEIIAHRPDGDITHVGEYLVIERPRRLAFTFAVPQFSAEYDLVTIEIRRLDAGCELTLINEMSPDVFAEWGDATRKGWSGMLAVLDAALPD